MMYSEVLAYDSPLYGRRTAQIRLEPIEFNYYSEFFENKTHNELIEYYSVTGGIPKYIQEFELDKSILWNVENLVFNSNNYLYSEPKFLLQEEITDLSRYFSILQAISNGDTKMSTISSRLGLNASSLTPYISKLIELDILEKEIPITKDSLKSKKSLYFIKDNYLAFWFNFVYPYQSYLEIETLSYPLKNVKEKFDLWVSKSYEKLCLRAILDEKAIDFPLLKIGRWWDKNTEIDIVALGDNEIVFGECKWSNKHVGLSVLYDLKEKAKKIKWKNDDRKEVYILFSKSGFSEDIKNFAKDNETIILSEF